MRTTFVRLPKPKPCILCGLSADFADDDRQEPLHDLCDTELWRIADAVNRAAERRLALEPK
jgi:hypothetical protein